ncbi:MAG: transposon-encoded TnpW family protein [Oscillospiraceae bacterium]|nr:transposon-encoded TnpW family protein [Oscillospiraceae bacterium]
MISIKTETKINGTLYCVTAECSPAATETVEQKLERMICRRASDTESYQSGQNISLALSEKVREHSNNIIAKG